jgi:uncharacterized protein
MQEIENPFGITVFGSATVRVEPDVAVLNFSVSRLKPEPKEAYEDVREAAQKIQKFLANAKLTDAGSSRINLSEAYEHKNGEQKFLGCRTRVEFRVVLSDLSRVEEILTGLIDAGVNNIGSVDFQTTRLKQIRAEARQKAVAAAREKAEIYCTAAGVALGDVIHIEDINPEQIERFRGHSQIESPIEDDGQGKAFNPGSIVVSGAVRVAYKFQGHQVAAGFLKGDLQ